MTILVVLKHKYWNDWGVLIHEEHQFSQVKRTQIISTGSWRGFPNHAIFVPEIPRRATHCHKRQPLDCKRHPHTWSLSRKIFPLVCQISYTFIFIYFSFPDTAITLHILCPCPGYLLKSTRALGEGSDSKNPQLKGLTSWWNQEIIKCRSRDSRKRPLPNSL